MRAWLGLLWLPGCFGVPAVVCGDDVLEASEQCDDGNNVNGDACPADCEIGPGCGDGVQIEGDACFLAVEKDLPQNAFFWNDALLTDLGGDGALDLLAAGSLISPVDSQASQVALLQGLPFAPTISTVALDDPAPLPSAISLIELGGETQLVVSSDVIQSVTPLPPLHLVSFAEDAFGAINALSFANATDSFGIDVADFDGDGDEDLIASLLRGGAGELQVLLQEGGTLTPDAGPVLDVESENIRAVELIVANLLLGDARPELVFLDREPNQDGQEGEIEIIRDFDINALIEFPDGDFFEERTDRFPVGLVLPELDGDLQPEIVFASRAERTITVIGAFDANNPFSGGDTDTISLPEGLDSIRDVKAANLDTNPLDEVVIVAEQDQAFTAIFIAYNGDFQNLVPLPLLNGEGVTAAIGDVDRDGIQDIVILAQGSPGRVLTLLARP